VLRIGGNAYALPFFNHAGNNLQLPEPCDCSKLTQAELSDPYSNCNVFRLLSGFMFWPVSDPYEVFALALKYQLNFTAINEAVFNASYISSYWGDESAYRTDLQSAASRSAAFDFCKLSSNSNSSSSCSLVTFSMFDAYEYSWAISSYYFQLRTGACQDTFSTSASTW
jgi:hypothetical protein